MILIFGLLSVTRKISRPLPFRPNSVRYLLHFHYRTLWHMSQPTNVSPGPRPPDGCRERTLMDSRGTGKIPVQWCHKLSCRLAAAAGIWWTALSGSPQLRVFARVA
ncbi:hypothetical protein KC333_g169 [Hortaea werneckii]|nr:hypothetical protein KC333_g169 [Hortaea werneckii]